MARFAAGDFVDFVDEDDAHLLGALDGHARDLIHVEEFVFFFLDQIFEGVGDAHLALLFLLAEHAGQHVFQIDVHLLDALVGDDFEAWHLAFAHFDVDHALIEFAFAELGAELFARALRLFALLRGVGFGCVGSRWRRRRQQEVENALFGGLLGAVGNFVELFFADHVDGSFDEIADH